MAKKLKTDKDGNIFLGTYNVPESWDELTFKQLCDINRNSKKNGNEDGTFNIYDNLEILTGHKRSEIDNLPYEFLESIMLHMTFLKTELPKVEPRPYIEVDGKRYVANITEKMTVGEYVSVDTVLRTDEDDLVSIVAVLFRLPGERYDEDYEMNKFDERKEMFGKLSCIDVLPAIGFFLKVWQASEMVSRLSSEVEGQIDQLIESLQNSRNSSDSQGSYWTRRKVLRKLRKLKKQISSTSSSM